MTAEIPERMRKYMDRISQNLQSLSSYSSHDVFILTDYS